MVAYNLYLEQTSGATTTILATVRLPMQQVGALATLLRKFYRP
ncbi:MAG: hypothetical protein ACYCUV_10015 [Phycisphaerae bacterium]